MQADEWGVFMVDYGDVDPASHVVDPQRLGSLLKGARHAAGFTKVQELVAALHDHYGINISVSAIAKYEQGRTIPPLEMLIMLCAVLEPYGGFDGLVSRATRSDVRDKVFGSP